MALASYAHATLAELERFGSFPGDRKAELLEEALAWASLEVNTSGLGGRKLVYVGPVESYVSIVSAQTITNGSSTPTVAGPPSSEGRTLIVRKTDPDRSISAGLVTITQASPALVETFDLTKGDEIHGIEFFTSDVTVALSGVVGAGAGDTLDVGTSTGLIELYSPKFYACEIRPLQWPIRRVHKVWEDSLHTFGDSTVIAAGTGYEIRNPSSIRRALARLSGAGIDSSWIAGRRVIKDQLSAGHKGTAEVPAQAKAVTLELAAWYFQWITGKKFGLQSVSDAAGNRTFSGPPALTSFMKERLGTEYRYEVDPTAEEAA